MSGHLETARYDTIRQAMVAVSPGAESAATMVPANEQPKRGAYSDDSSLSRQLGQVVLAPSSLEPNLVSPPEGIVLTAFSAIPVADSVRGFYQELDYDFPTLEPIYANSRLSHDHYYNRSTPDGLATEAREIARLRALFAGAEHVSVIDQLVSSGYTISYAAQLLHAAGVKKVSTIRGYWYSQASPSDVSIEPLTSTHAPFMTLVGHQAAQTANEYYKHFANRALVAADGQVF